MDKKYLECEALIKELNKVPAYFDSGDVRWGIEIAMSVVEKQPTADVVEVRHGYIIEHEGKEDDYYCECSVCKTHELSLEDKYCSECGAKMDRGKK